MKDGLKFNTENARLYVFKDQIRMLIAIVWCLVTGTLFTGVSVYFCHINRYRIDYIQFNLCSAIFLFIICIFTIKWQSLLQTNHVPDRLPLLILVMTIAGIAITSGMLLMIAAMKSGYSDVVWSVCQSSMIIPFITSILLNGESVKLCNIIGIISIIFGIIILGTKQKINSNQAKKGWLVLTLIAFFVVGGGQYCFSIPSFWPGWQDTYSLRIPIQATGGLLLLICLTRPAQLFKNKQKIMATRICICNFDFRW